MKINFRETKVSGSQLVYSYSFSNGYTAEQWNDLTPFVGGIKTLVWDSRNGAIVSDEQEKKVLQLILEFNRN